MTTVQAHCDRPAQLQYSYAAVLHAGAASATAGGWMPAAHTQDLKPRRGRRRAFVFEYDGSLRGATSVISVHRYGRGRHLRGVYAGVRMRTLGWWGCTLGSSGSWPGSSGSTCSAKTARRWYGGGACDAPQMLANAAERSTQR